MYHFCTYFDHHYLLRGLALYQSLKRYCPSFQLWVLCMDGACHEVLSQLDLPDVRLIPLEDFERGDEELLKAKKNRSLLEYYFTCTPSLPLFIFNKHPEVDIITYLDADLFFFADPAPLYDEMADHSIAIIGHRHPPNFRHLDRYGMYNVGWLSFRRDEHAFACLRWWRERCIEWCYYRCEDGKYADQKYLDDWPTHFKGVVVLRHKGANLAPWNIANYRIHGDGNCVWVDEQPLIFFHFFRFKQIKDWLYDPNLVGYKVRPSKIVRRDIFAPYIWTLLDVTEQVSPLLQEASLRSSMREQIPQHAPLLRRVVRELRRVLDMYIGILTQRYTFVVNKRVI